MNLKSLTAAIRRIERQLSPADKWASKLRQTAYNAAQRILTPIIGVQFTREKERGDYITTTNANVKDVENALWDAGYQRNMLSTWKYRTVNGKRQDIVSAWVYDPTNTPTQHDVYLFENDDGSVDIYGHKEPSVRNPSEHLDLSTGTHGDPNKRTRAAFAEAGISFETNKNY